MTQTSNVPFYTLDHVVFSNNNTAGPWVETK